MLAGVIMVAAAAASWGTWSLFLRPAGLPVGVTTPLLFAVMALVALPGVLRTKPVTWNRRIVGLLVLNALFDAGNIVTFFGAIAKTTVAIAVLTHYAAPIFITLIAPYIDREADGRLRAPTPGARPAAAVALVGLVIIMAPWSEPVHGAFAGGALGLASAVCYCGNSFCVRRLAETIGAPRQMTYHSAIAVALTLPLLALAPLHQVTMHGILIVTAGSVTIGAISGMVYAIGLVRIGAARSAVLTFAEPIVAVIVGVLAWGEAVAPSALVGGALVLGAGIWVTRGANTPTPD
ncbi:MAG TPA: DMT family transporter [Kofleriaceae bacterium]|jgi:drug/metabolite transporter (DMT)-like permease